MATPRKTTTGRWQIQIEVAGVRDSGTFQTKREAQAWAEARAVELRSVRGGKVGTVKTLRDALRRYADEVTPHKRGWAKELIRLKAFEGEAHRALPVARQLSELTVGDVALWRDARLKMTARGSVLRDLTLLSSVFELARREWGWVDVNVVRDVGKPANPDHRERIITGAEVRRMLRQLGYSRATARSVSQAVAACFLVALATGMRAGELCGLRWDDVHANYCTLRTSKTGKGRDVPLPPGARALIERMRGWDEALVFGLSSQTLDALFRRARDRAGFSGFTFHDSRHTAATRLAQRLHVLDLCKMFGWANTKRALTYYNPRASEIAARLSAAAPTQSPR
ncbi:MAG: tyrosine-type recombinase/integrase [Burkholderiaceae bacterium]